VSTVGCVVVSIVGNVGFIGILPVSTGISLMPVSLKSWYTICTIVLKVL
jgi:hypothetical protein